MAYVREIVQHHNQPLPPSSLPIKLETAYDILQPYRLSFDIAQIDRCLNLTDRGGGSSNLCISSTTDKVSSNSSSSLRHVNNTLLTRLCVRALMSRRQGGFESPSIIFIDAGNCSDIYQCVNFARQYGLDIQKVLDSIIVSRPFNIHQLAGLLINELDAAIIEQRFGGAKLLVISDMLKMLTQQRDSQIEPDEAHWIVREIARSIRKLSRHILVAVSIRECPVQYRSLLLSLFDNQIHIAGGKEPIQLQVKVSANNLRDDYDCKKQPFFSSSSFSCMLTDKDLRIIPSR